jgi:Mce-associated membrane protein
VTETDLGSPTSGRPPGTTLRWGLAVFLALVVVVAAVLVVLEVTTLRPRDRKATADDRARSQVVQAAERFTVQLNTYDSSSIKGYEKTVKTMLSPKFAASFDKDMQQLSSAIVQGKMTSKGQVLASAVANLDPDSAQVLVVADADASTVYDKSVARHFRWQVSLVNIDGRWLVDKYEPVGT